MDAARRGTGKLFGENVGASGDPKDNYKGHDGHQARQHCQTPSGTGVGRRKHLVKRRGPHSALLVGPALHQCV